ncbi:hypothetical protein PCH_Pc19g00280 [Penicillium rubens Wisconsin 54-1255]|uniref:Uncharacterized protein n=1 Tax=Penicillium rubens (strain ATCC 28089 / DSM 1075 / NRRL 1951 / Wisconsin 54-1255) TaxID=500485 RepID=B6HD21_PENRW|nr:hypothetical protein PCH_Pc19g00280 [Penicillium rubens Wisconsin 54-1255]
MSPRSACGWPEWEEKNLLSWLDAHRDLSWKALSDAYYEEYQVGRSVESLRGKKYHIMRKQHRTGAKVPRRSVKQKRPGDVRRSAVDSGSRSTLPDNTSAQRNIDKRFQTILAADPSQSGDSDKPAQTTRSEKRNGDTGEKNVHTSSMSSAGALHCYFEGTVANRFDKVVLVKEQSPLFGITTIVRKFQSQRSSFEHDCGASEQARLHSFILVILNQEHGPCGL